MSVARVLSAELLKFRSVSSYLWAVGLGAATVAVAAFALASTEDDASVGLLVSESVALPMEYFAYLMMVLGVLTVTADIEAGTLRTQAMLVPWRGRVVAAKLGAAAVVGTTAAVSVLLLVVGAALAGRGGGGLGWSAPETAATVVSHLAAVPLAMLVGVGAGLLLRSTALTVSALLLWSFGAETILVFVIPEEYGAFLAFKTIGASRSVMGELGAAEGLGIFVLFTVLVAALGALTYLRRREVPA